MLEHFVPGRSSLFCLIAGVFLLLPSRPARGQNTDFRPTGILSVDLREGLADTADAPRPAKGATGRKSVLLAGGLSALVPGAGQIYAEAPLWRTLVYGAVEVAGWTLFGVYSAEGDRATADFENFADAHWDITRYISWIGENFEKWGDDEVNKQAAREALAAIYVSGDPSLRPWERIDFAQLNKLEAAVTGGFSHTLPTHGEQQYYEQIGKYIQYRAGWDDHNPVGDTIIYNPSRVTDRNREYVADRERANDLLSYAGAALWVLALNHVVSTVDAMLETRSYNISLSSELRGETLPNGHRRYTPAIGMTMRF